MSRKGNDLLVGLLDTYNDCNTRDDKTVKFPNLYFKDKNGVDRTEETISMMDNLFFTNSLAVEHIYSKKTNFNWREKLNKAIGLAKEKLIRLLESGKGIDDLSYKDKQILKKYLTSIDIPDSDTSIGNYAFSYCTSLKSINIPDSVISIGNLSFYKCTSLTSINIPNSVTSIGNDAFSYCTSLTSINIPDSVTSIGDYVFSNCESLKSINIPNSVTSIGTCAFDNCTSLKSIDIPNSVEGIGGNAFFGCKSLTSIDIPDSVTSIGNAAFSLCTSLRSIVVSEDSEIYDPLVNAYGDIVKTKESFQLNECQQYWIKRFITN